MQEILEVKKILNESASSSTLLQEGTVSVKTKQNKQTKNKTKQNIFFVFVILYFTYKCHICGKGFLDSNLNKLIVIDKLSNSHKIAANFTYTRAS